ncbi:hypothetical protein ACVPOR_12250 [Staphylococcus aureus]
MAFLIYPFEYCYLTNIGPPGPTGILNQMMTNTVHTMLSAIEYGIKLESKAPSFMHYDYYYHKLMMKVITAS